MMRLSLFTWALPALTIVFAPLHAVHAQGGRAVTIDLMLPDDNGNFVSESSVDKVTDYFNLPRCQCAEAAISPDPVDDWELFFQVKLTAEDFSSTEQADLAVGSSCDNDDPSVRRCDTIEAQLDVGQLGGVQQPIRVDRLMFPTSACQEIEVSRNVWLLYDDGADDIIDESYTLASGEISADAQPPPLPIESEALSGENAVNVTWDPPEGRFDDIEYFYVLCARTDDPTTPLFPEEANKDGFVQYDTTDTLCGIPVGGVVIPPDVDAGVPDAGVMVDAGMVDAGIVDAGIVDDAGLTPDGGTPVSRDDMTSLDPSFVCGRAASSKTSLRIGDLENGVEYEFAILTVDDARNASYQYVGTATPSAVTDFWEDYNENGGRADGGVCLVTSTYGDGGGAAQAMRAFRDNTLASFALGRMMTDMYYDYVAPLGVYAERSFAFKAMAAVVLAPFVALAVVWEYTGPLFKVLLLLGFILWRKRDALRTRIWPRLRERLTTTRVAAASAAIVLVAGATSAGAQGYDPWQEFAPVSDTPTIQPSKWNFGIKLGPYLPEVDSEFSLAEGEMGPYQSMFGRSTVMTQFELDRFFLWPSGQFGVTGSIGFMGKTANAYSVCPADETRCVGDLLDKDENGVPDRSEGEETAFRLVPMTVGVVYRFTALDDRTKVPLVPYAKAGFSYYLWWVRQPSGALAEAPTAECPEPSDPMAGCAGDTALGASIGLQASVGLAVRADRIDRGAALSLREEFGVEHAGFYAELMYAKVDGFGSDSKLAVGDLTWFAGLNFEF